MRPIYADSRIPMNRLITLFCRPLTLFFSIILILMPLSACTQRISTNETEEQISYPQPDIITTSLNPEDITNAPRSFTPQQLLNCGAFHNLSYQENLASQRIFTQWSNHALQHSRYLKNLQKHKHLTIGVDILTPPFSYINKVPRGLLTTYARLLNYHLYHNIQVKFVFVHGYEEEKRDLNTGKIDLALTPYPITCTQIHELANTPPLYHTQLVLAGFQHEELTNTTTGQVCLEANPLLAKIVATFYPNLDPIYTTSPAHCQVLLQQGKKIYIASQREPLLILAPQSAIHTLTPFMNTWMNATASKRHPELIALVNAVQKYIHNNYQEQELLRTSLLIPNLAPLARTRTQLCNSQLAEIKNEFTNSTNIIPILDDINKNFNLPTNNISLQGCEH